METFNLGRIEFVSGLHWQVLSSKPDNAKNEIRQLAKQLSFDLSVHRKTGVPQVGLASREEGCHHGMRSAAAVVSKTLELEHDQRDFLCATELPDGRFLYVAQSEGVILPDGDQIDSSESIQARLLNDLSLGKTWECIIAPGSWGIERSQERDFSSFLPLKNGKPDFKHSWWSLTPIELSLVDSLKKFVLPAAALAVVVACYLGFEKWKALDDAKEAQRIALEAQLATQSAPPPHPWKDRPRAASFVAACLKSMDSTKTLWPGNWIPVNAICDSKKNLLTITWKRGEHGWVRHLLEILPDAKVSPDGSTATLIVSLALAGMSEDEAPISEEQRTLELNRIAQEYRISFSMSAPAVPQALPGATAATSATLPWKELSWSIKAGSLSPNLFARDFDGPGFRIETLTAVFNGGVISWEIGGSQYVK